MPDLGTPLEQVLQDKLLNIGDYQRPFAWEEKQLADLWSDIDLLGSLPHYTGTLVLQDMGEARTTRSGQVLTVFDVVDGQQRLTTCIVLLDRLRRALLDFDGDDAAEAAHDLERLLYINIEGVQRPRLALAGDLRSFFTDSVLGEEAPEGRHLQLGARRLVAATAYFDQQISGLIADVPAEVSLPRLLALRARTCHQLRFLVYSVDRSDEVGVLFETVNGRGKDLTELERVKNYLLYISRQLNFAQRDDVAENINRSWSEIFSNLSRVGLRDDALLRAHWLVTQDANTRNWHGADSVKAMFPRSAYVPGSSRLAGVPLGEEIAAEDDDQRYMDLKAYIDSLRRSSGILADVHDSGATYPAFGASAMQVAQTTASLRRSGSVASFHTLLLAIRLAHDTDAALYLRGVEFCERFSARVWAIRGLRSNAGESSIRWSARDLYMGAAPGDVLAALEQRLWQLAPDDEVRANFAVSVQWYPRSTAHKFLLYEYELSKQRDASDIPQFGDVTAKGNKTTEHILPQTPTETRIGGRASRASSTRSWCTGSGILSTRDNSRYGNRDYLDSDDGRFGKRGHEGQSDPWCYYGESNLAREREVAIHHDQWTPDEIERRAAEIASWHFTDGQRTNR